ncbi:thiamine-monophosphate kinase [Candidatus Kinetoplastibacterium desouzaii TCC079E]|uniref:Thiamine-monophosphate kinase n=1 Tax=Candidatus Kinetoplastidibacterium desouzai TCC079E TaxID=1208919 RepID=M1LRR6_9PROT|nr:thiamine-phosphate kinase [Candidatus Kinetoplastibacterium desouzaii]AGF46831.1 thiamine-monophosphate kinase [Candidatus Kinetoplastibacterium desouzaii TCC079E]
MSEFDIIKKYFSRPVKQDMLGVGDDCALFSAANGFDIAVSKDLLIEDIHFFHDVDPISLGHKSLTVSLSDLAAMGASPLACLLGIAMPVANEKWLAKFSEGFYNLSNCVGCPLIGGDTVRSQQGIIISITVLGQVPFGQAIRRDGAQIDDEIWVSGDLGSADIACRIISSKIENNKFLLSRTINSLEWPNARLNLGHSLRGVANSAIDISDGLIQDLTHILNASNLGAFVYYDNLPFDNFLLDSLSKDDIKKSILNGGDVYELCFTAPKCQHNNIINISKELNIKLSLIGGIVSKRGLDIIYNDGSILDNIPSGFSHF